MDNELLAGYLESTIVAKIPLAREMQVRVAGYDGNSLVLQAPLAPNVNDKGTAFGGSLYSLAVLAGWGLLSIKLKEENFAGEVVIHESKVSYRLPVTGDLEARCTAPGEPEYTRFIEDLRVTGKGGISLEVRIMRGSRVAVQFSGSYVAYRKSK